MPVGQTPDFRLVPGAPEFFHGLDGCEKIMNGFNNQHAFRTGKWLVGKQVESRDVKSTASEGLADRPAEWEVANGVVEADDGGHQHRQPRQGFMDGNQSGKPCPERNSPKADRGTAL